MKITLPSTAEAWVEVDPRRALVGDIYDDVALVARIVTKWNITDDQGKMLPITKQAIEKLRYGDVLHIARKSAKYMRPDRARIREVILALNNTDPDSDMPVPIDYVLFEYRRAMGISYSELLTTPLYIFNQDREFIGLENQRRRND